MNHITQKSMQKIISHYSYDSEESTENPNGWEQEYYDMKIYDDPEAYVEILNDHWEMPDLSDKVEKYIEEV